MTIDDYLNAGAYFAREPSGTDPAPVMAASGLPRADIQARHDLLVGIDPQRCVISELQRQFLERVLALMP